MRYFKNKLKDEEVPTLLFLMENLLDVSFGKEYHYVVDEDIQNFIAKADSSVSNIKPISITVIKSMLEMMKSDTGYRPKYKSMEFVIFGLFGKKLSFFRYQKEHKIGIEDYFKEFEYDIVLKNPEKSSVVLQNKKTVANLGDIQVAFNIGEGFVEKLVKEVSIFTGNLLEQKIKQNPKDFGLVTKPRINKRLQLKEERRQSNIDNIVAKAIEFAREYEASDDPTDPDWIIEFFNIAQDCSNENMQYLWAKLLASEVGKPSSISRRTLSIIKLLEPKEAQVFTKLCNCVWNINNSSELRQKVLFKDMYNEPQNYDSKWNFDSMFIPHLEDIGLVSQSFIDMKPNKAYELDFFERKHGIKASKKLAQLEIITLTRAGEEIFRIVKPEPNLKYYEFIIDYFNKVNILM